ncbi:MAG TPA: FecR domain-containing protein [Chitinophagaceae bacterium]|nr:FecR domain-containing protein [Chitinophagaceae bacterium]
MDNQHLPSKDRLWSLLSKKLANETSPEKLKELENLLLKNPELQYQAELLTEMWLQPAQQYPAESEAAYMRHLVNHKDEFFSEEISEEAVLYENEIPEERGYFRHLISRTQLVVWFASLILAGAVLFFLFQPTNYNHPPTEAISSVVTKNGNRTKIVLPDGSQIWLNAGSTLDYNNLLFNKDLREVSLNGEAYFDVVKNAEKPFIIHTRKMDIKVLGTSFNVRSYSNEKIAEAALIKGSIEVTLKDRKDQKIILKPNEKISIAAEEAESTSVINKRSAAKTIHDNIIPQIVVKELKPNPVNNIISEIAWTQNKLYFEDGTLEDIGLMIERWFGKKVTIQSEALRKARYTGNFENETMAEVLLSLKLSKPFNFRIENETVVIY